VPVVTTAVYASVTTSWSNYSIATLGAITASVNDCVSLTSGETWTTYILVPNTTTVVQTVYANNISTSFSTTSEFTPPVLCATSQVAGLLSSATEGSNPPFPFSKQSSQGLVPAKTFASTSGSENSAVVVTAIITSKNGVTSTTTVAPPNYGKTEAHVTVVPTTTTKKGGGLVLSIPPVSTTPKKTVQLVVSTTAEAVVAAVEPLTSVAPNGVTVIVSPSNAIIGDQTVNIGSTTAVVTQNGAVYTVGPSQVVGPSLVVNVPSTAVRAVAAPVTTTTLPTNIIILDGEPFSVIGSSVVVLGSSTITYGPSVPAQTSVVNGETITIGPSGVSFDGTTLGGTAHPSGTQIGLAGGLSITEIGSTIAVIDGVTLTVGPSASAYTTVINGHTITAGSSGLGLGGTTLQYPFNPTTNAVAVGSVTFTEIGSTLAVIGGTTYTFGAGAKPTTVVVNGETISIGSGGIGFSTTTFVSYSPTATGSAALSTQTGKKNAGERTRPIGSVVMCVVIWVAYMV
jgi:hypothetical protein